MDNRWPHFLRDVDNLEHGGVPRNFRPQQRNHLNPRVTGSLLCDLNIVGGVSAVVNDGEEGDCVGEREREIKERNKENKWWVWLCFGHLGFADCD